MIKYESYELVAIWLDSFIGLSYSAKFKIYNLIKESNSIRKTLEENAKFVISVSSEKLYTAMISSTYKEYLDYQLSELGKYNVIAITFLSDTYPKSLVNIESPPFVLYAKGDISLLNSNCFSIVGSRRSIPLSESIAKNYAQALSKAGMTLVTGIAEGIDSVVIKTALKETGKIISIIPGGFKHVYPKSNEQLLEKVMENGLALTEHTLDIQSDKYMYQPRNRLIAGLSRGTLVVSGRKQSGTRLTAEWAESFSRDLFAIPYSIGISSGEGCNDLIKNGAKLTDTPDDILEFYGLEKQNETQDLTEEEKEIIKVLQDGELHIEQISAKIKLDISKVSATILMLEIKGLVVKSGTNIYGLTT